MSGQRPAQPAPATDAAQRHSYAAGYVSGVAALVRSNYPELTAAQVMHRLTATAHNGARDPSNVVGAGILDQRRR
ncbi:subtilase family protein [Mycobacterium ulcerans str. Harvey]|uniref:Subtilase family protein n=1 Tax=Mycobacterium ulcerans str. Harvey TaxID=1299332 RepID=A0ABN0R3K4_MYCUL|nr:subtilase family protein [Mycobacterium ulcerans str. Harvey]